MKMEWNTLPTSGRGTGRDEPDQRGKHVNPKCGKVEVGPT